MQKPQEVISCFKKRQGKRDMHAFPAGRATSMRVFMYLIIDYHDVFPFIQQAFDVCRFPRHRCRNQWRRHFGHYLFLLVLHVSAPVRGFFLESAMKLACDMCICKCRGLSYEACERGEKKALQGCSLRIRQTKGPCPCVPCPDLCVRCSLVSCGACLHCFENWFLPCHYRFADTDLHWTGLVCGRPELFSFVE